ncbi:MAG: hypothetical protein ACFCBU_13520 [Cyanophyceae cyanobacterium]
MNPVELSAKFLLQCRVLLGITIALAALSWPPIGIPQWAKTASSISAGIALIGAVIQYRDYERYSKMAGVYSDHQVRAFGGFLQATTDAGTAMLSGMYAPGAVPAKVAEAQLLPSSETFDWQLFNSEPDTYAHLAIVGPTGSGKSTLAEALATHLGGITMAIAPHRKPGDFKALGNRVYCGGRNYGTAEDQPADFDELLQGTCGAVSVVSVLSAIETEMDDRYNLWDQGKDPGPFVNVIWDETLASIAAQKKVLVPEFITLLREARKVRIRLIILPQNDRVEALGLKGKGADRDSLTYVRLGKEAINHASKLERSHKGILEMVQSQRRPCLVEDMPAIVPEYNPAMVVLPGHVPKAIAPAPEPPTDPLITGLNSLLNLNEPVIISPEEDEKFLSIIQAFGEGRNQVTASDLMTNRNALKPLKKEKINPLLEKLVRRGIGDLIWQGDTLKWLPPPTGTNGTNSQ